MTERDDDKVFGFHHVLWYLHEAVVTKVKGHQLFDLEQIRRKTRVSQGVVTSVDNLRGKMGGERRSIRFMDGIGDGMERGRVRKRKGERKGERERERGGGGGRDNSQKRSV